MLRLHVYLHPLLLLVFEHVGPDDGAGYQIITKVLAVRTVYPVFKKCFKMSLQPYPAVVVDILR